ncbi:cell cycle control protein cwf15, putative [Plasmodium relictum]|uniref:Cell cycle control protein cwf15, putative n=1 Tax=Plasmodium relictum TaxID=85471 RepID=A0A1J1HCF3_PLARL|nr:cell cycle control protein cwf15, putative [Plasmodium relictum]CRH02983.1 cell cycle control protein cwf15, putative [Plasmodium relictum]
MTTAHRPTWYNAIGGENQGGNRKVSQTVKVCSRDLPSHTKMKMRDLSDYVEDKTLIKNNLIKLENNNNNDTKTNKLLAIENIKKFTNQDYTNPFPEDEDDEINDFKSTKKKKKKKNLKIRNLDYSDTNKEEHTYNEKDEDDEDEDEDEDEDDDDEDDDDDDDDEDDDEEKELLRELENLKREKLEKLKKEKEEQEIMKNRKNNVLTNNPLINLEDSSDNEDSEQNIKKRKWTDEAIFRNTCKKKEKTISFINDTVRSAFHKKFLFKYIH